MTVALTRAKPFWQIYPACHIVIALENKKEKSLVFISVSAVTHFLYRIWAHKVQTAAQKGESAPNYEDHYTATQQDQSDAVTPDAPKPNAHGKLLPAEEAWPLTDEYSIT